MAPSINLHPSSLPTISLILLISHSSIPQPILDQLLHLSLTAIYESSYPSSLSAWLKRITDLQPHQQAHKTAAEVQETMMALQRGGLDALTGWLNELKPLYPSSEEDENSLTSTPLHRSSPLALFLRRFRMNFAKLSFDEAVAWWDEVVAWFEGRWVEKDLRTKRRRVADEYTRAQAAQDYQATKDASSFYDLDDSTSAHSKPQYALLNTAFLEYLNGGWQSAREALAETIQVARNASDSRCLAAAASLHKRLEAVAPLASTSSSFSSATVSFGEGRPSPTDLLWEVKRLSSQGTPLPFLLPSLYSSHLLFTSPPSALPPPPHSSTTKDKENLPSSRPPTYANDWAFEPSFHAVSAFVWEGLGSDELAEVRGGLALECVEAERGGWGEKMAVLSRRSRKLARANRGEEALAMLLSEVDTRAKRRTLGVLELRAWERAVWDVCGVDAELRDDQATLEQLKRLGPGEVLHWSAIPSLADEGSESLKEVSQLYNTARRLLDSPSPIPALSPCLRALHLSAQNVYTPLRLRCVILLTQVRCAISPNVEEAEKGLAELDGVWGEVLTIGRGDRELMGLGLEARGRLGVMKAGEDDEEIIRALPNLQQAQEHFGALSLLRPSQRLLALLAHLCDHLSLSPSPLPPPTAGGTWTQQRDAYAQRHLEEAERAKRAKPLLSSQLVEVINGVRRAVGAKFVL